jgi:hypothetical protein
MIINVCAIDFSVSRRSTLVRWRDILKLINMTIFLESLGLSYQKPVVDTYLWRTDYALRNLYMLRFVIKGFGLIINLTSYVMKNCLALMSVLVFVLGIAFAQDTALVQLQSQPPSAEQGSQSASSEYLFRVTDILGRELQDPQGELIGQVEDLIITKDDDVARIIVSVGGFLGIGERLVAISYEGLRIDPQKGIIVHDVAQQELIKQPEFHYKEKQMEKPIRSTHGKDS